MRSDAQRALLWVSVIVMVVSLLRVFAADTGAATASLPVTGATDEVPTLAQPAPCSTIRASKWNGTLRKLREVTGSKRGHKFRSRPVCLSAYKDLKHEFKKAKRDCLKLAKTTGSSYYGYADSGGIVGSCGMHLLTAKARYSFAVMQSGNVVSRCGQRLCFYRAGHGSACGVQADTGGGGGAVGGHPRSFDFWEHPEGGGLARKLGLTRSGLAVVRYSPHNCWV